MQFIVSVIRLSLRYHKHTPFPLSKQCCKALRSNLIIQFSIVNFTKPFIESFYRGLCATRCRKEHFPLYPVWGVALHGILIFTGFLNQLSKQKGVKSLPHSIHDIIGSSHPSASLLCRFLLSKLDRRF